MHQLIYCLHETVSWRNKFHKNQLPPEGYTLNPFFNQVISSYLQHINTTWKRTVLHDYQRRKNIMKKKAQQKTTSQLQFLSFLSNTWLLYKCITFVVFKSGYRFVNPRLSFSRSALTFPQRLCAVRKESATEIQLTPGREEKKTMTNSWT